MRVFGLILAFLLMASTPAWAVQPDELLDDPVMEARARVISAGLRCPVCRNESIDESNATISRELRLLVRERLVAGDSNAEVVDFVVVRFGEFVLLQPDKTGANLILWLAAPGMLLAALGVGWMTIRRRPKVTVDALTDAEQDRIDELLR